jgi:hypothetical protein
MPDTDPEETKNPEERKMEEPIGLAPGIGVWSAPARNRRLTAGVFSSGGPGSNG